MEAGVGGQHLVGGHTEGTGGPAYATAFASGVLHLERKGKTT